MVPHPTYTFLKFCPRCDYANTTADIYCTQCRLRLVPTIVTRLPYRNPRVWWKWALLISGALGLAFSLLLRQ